MSKILARCGQLGVHSVLIALAVCSSFRVARADEKLSDPILRVANETPAVQPATPPAPQQAAVAVAATAPTGSCPFDLTAKPGEHPLAPVIRAVKASQEEIDGKIR